MLDGKTTRLNIYVKDVKLFKKLQNKIRTQWYEQFGETLSYAEVMMKALLFFLDNFEKEDLDDHSGQNLHKYGRIGL